MECEQNKLIIFLFIISLKPHVWNNMLQNDSTIVNSAVQ